MGPEPDTVAGPVAVSVNSSGSAVPSVTTLLSWRNAGSSENRQSFEFDEGDALVLVHVLSRSSESTSGPESWQSAWRSG